MLLAWASLVAQSVKNPPAMWETWVRSLGWEDPWRKEQLPTPVFGLESNFMQILFSSGEWVQLKGNDSSDSRDHGLVVLFTPRPLATHFLSPGSVASSVK